MAFTRMARESCLKPNLSSVNAALPSRSGNGSEEKGAYPQCSTTAIVKFAIPIALKSIPKRNNAPEKPLGCCYSMRFGIRD